MFGRSQKTRWTCPTLDTMTAVSARQSLIPEWDQERYSRAKIAFVGAGGINGEIGEGVVRKGVGEADFYDGDTVEPSNLNRQKFVKQSLFKNKAMETCRIFSSQGFLGTRLFAHPYFCRAQELAAMNVDVIVCGVDNQFPETRLEVCKSAFESKTPAVFVAISLDADYGYCFLQRPGGACWNCLFKSELASEEASKERRCPGVPAVADTLKMLAGFALYAIDSLVMERKIDWNYRIHSLSRKDFGGGHFIARRKGCPVCGEEGAA